VNARWLLTAQRKLIIYALVFDDKLSIFSSSFIHSLYPHYTLWCTVSKYCHLYSGRFKYYDTIYRYICTQYVFYTQEKGKGNGSSGLVKGKSHCSVSKSGKERRRMGFVFCKIVVLFSSFLN